MKPNLNAICLLSAIILSIALGCNTSNNNAQKDLAKDTVQMKNEFDKAKKVFYSFPAPHEVASLLMDYPDAKYSEELLNPIQSVSDYNSNKSMALNLGIYIADLSYANLFQQNQAIVNYMATTKKLAEQMGIMKAIDDKTINKLKENINNRDAIVKIISETFMNSDAYLQDNNRQETSCIIVVGGWLECLYLSTKLTEKSVTKNKEMAQRITEQGFSISLLISLLEDYKKDTDVASILEDMKSLNVLFEKAQANDKGIDAKAFTALCDKVEVLRKGYVKL